MGFGATKRRKHSKPGSTTLRAFHFRIETSDTQFKKLHETFDLAWALQNQQTTALSDSRKAARETKLKGEEPQYLSGFDLKKLVAGKLLEPRFLGLHSQVRQALSLRVMEGQSRWFEAMKEGRRHVRPPTAMPRKKFRSITYPQYGTAAKIHHSRLHLSKLGEFRLIGWRKMRGAKKSVTIKFKEGHFWAIVMCEVQECDVCRPYAEVQDVLPDGGIDPGLSSVLTDSTGKNYETPKPLKAAQKKLCHIQKDVSRKFEVRKALHLKELTAVRERTGSKAPVAEGLIASLREIPYSNRLKANIQRLAKAHTKVERIRMDVARKNARKVERSFARAAVEDHSLQFMVKNRRLAKATMDVAIGKQKQAIQSAMGHGRYFAASNRRAEGGNSQTCLCGAATPKALKDRWHACPECGLEGPRDQVSAIIVQHTTFGTLPVLGADSAIKNSKECVPGLGILEHAAKVLETRRGESKGRKTAQGKPCSVNGESHATESISAVTNARAFEPSVKRPAQRIRSMRKTTGGVPTPSVEVKTTQHADPVSPCGVETKVRVPLRGGKSPLRERFTTRKVVVMGIAPRSTLLPRHGEQPSG
jgi:transposase